MLPLLVAAVSCGDGGTPEDLQAGADSPPPAEALNGPSDRAVISLIYDPGYSVPQNFFVDERASLGVSYTVHHVLDESRSFEVCSDDFATARALEQADNDSRSVSGYYVGAYENDRYFEFIRELSYDSDVGNIDDLTSPGFSRVFKCSTLSRDGVDRSLLSGYAGRLNARPVETSDVSEIAEYLWQFAFFPERVKKVLDSYPDGSGDVPGHTLLLGFASTQGPGRCDRIEVVEWRFRADTASGALSTEFDRIRAFEAEVVAGSPRLCP
jgi:hypothetical protein